MKLSDIEGRMLDFGSQFGISITLANGKRHAVRAYLIDLDSEELPELLSAMGKELRKWVRENGGEQA